MIGAVGYGSRKTASTTRQAAKTTAARAQPGATNGAATIAPSPIAVPSRVPVCLFILQ